MIELAIGAAVVTFAKAWQASDIDEKTLNTLRRAHSKHAEAISLFERHKETADMSLIKLANRKKAMLSTHMNDFIAVYGRIRKIDFRPGDGILELSSTALSVEQVEEIQHMTTSSMKPLSQKEMAVKYIFSGIGGVILEDSKRNAAIANSQNRIANTLYSQAQTMVVAVDAIGQRAEQISKILAQLGLLFSSSIKAVNAIIEKNGNRRERYSKSDKEILVNCVNMAKSVKIILDTPILNADGSLTQVSLKALEEGQLRLKNIQQRIGG